MAIDYCKAIFFAFCLGLMTTIISLASYYSFNIKQVKDINYTSPVPLEIEAFTRPYETTFNYDTLYNCLTSDGQEFIQQYKEKDSKDIFKNLGKFKQPCVTGANNIYGNQYTIGNGNGIAGIPTKIPFSYNVNEKIRKIITTYQKFGGLRNNISLKKKVIDSIPIGRFSKVEQIAKPVLCLFNYISNQFELEIDIKDDARYFYEFLLAKFVDDYCYSYKRYYDESTNVEKSKFNHCYDNIIENLLLLFEYLYRFTNSPNEVLSRTFYHDFYNIDFENSANLIRPIHDSSIVSPNQYNNYNNVYFPICDIYEYNLQTISGKKFIFFDFPLEKIFPADFLKGLRINNCNQYKDTFSKIKDKIVTTIKNEIYNNRHLYNNSNDEVVILLPSKREFLKLACLNNYKEFFPLRNGGCFYDYTDIKNDYKWNNDIQTNKEKLNDQYESLADQPKSNQLVFYKEFYDLHEDLITPLQEFLDNEINNNFNSPNLVNNMWY